MTFDEFWKHYVGGDKDKSLETGRIYAASAWDYQQARIDRLITGYTEAIVDIECWGAYASDYFQQKHDLEGCIKAHEALLEAEK